MMNPLATMSLIIPLYNEEKNIPALIEMLIKAQLELAGVTEIILVNNGSKDNSQSILEIYGNKLPGAKILNLEKNLEYGGGVFAGLLKAKNDFVGFIPGDLQVSADDFFNVWQSHKSWLAKNNTSNVLFKGQRVLRMDSKQMQFTSRCYTKIANLILGLAVNDCNGLPKIFHRKLLAQLPKEKMTSFTFDVQLIFTASKLGWAIEEVPVSFLARREGVSSWSGKRLKVYFRTFKEILRLKKIYAGISYD